MALQASQFGDVCYGTVADAINAYFASQPVAELAGAITYLNTFQYLSGGWKVVQYSISSTGVWSVNYVITAYVPNLAQCDPTAAYFDGMALGWGVATAMFTALAIVFIKRSFFS